MKRSMFRKKVWIIVGLLSVVTSGFAQNQQEGEEKIEKLVIDPDVRYGVLSNGLTYYIRHNETIKERAEFYIAHNVGSMQEEEDQRGLAHFLEHMAFNGSTNFPSKEGIKDYAESLGMRMGEGLNAYTAFDETVYMLMNVPVTREGVIDSCLLILHDWSSSLLLDKEAIEKERGVIREEWRTRQNAQMRLWEQLLPVMYPESKYGFRMPIGTLEVINNFEDQELKDYYKKWYRPDLQAIIIVGDIDVDKVEEKIKKKLGAIPASENPERRYLYPVQGNPIPLVSIVKDKEMTHTILQIYYKHDNLPYQLKGTIADVLTEYCRMVISTVMSERFAEIVQKANAPFVAASASDGNFFVSKTKGAWTSAAVLKPDEIERGLFALVAETERVKKFGFTEAEYTRAKETILKNFENLYNEREKQQNNVYAEKYVAHFTDGDYIPGIAIEQEIIKQFAADFPLEGINQYISGLFEQKRGGENIVISLMGPDKEDMEYPTEDILLQMFVMASIAEVRAGEEEAISKVLIPELPTPGKIVSVKEDALFGTTVYTLSNGARVVIKPTDYKKDEIQMTAISPGGKTMFKDEKDIWNLKVINDVIWRGGLGEFSANTIGKVLAGKNVNTGVGLMDDFESMNGQASPSDLKTLFELIYLQFTALRTDEDAYTSFVERVKPRLDNEALSPGVVFSDSLIGKLFNNHPRNVRLRSSDFEKVDYQRMLEMCKERFADASDFIFTFVGNVDKDTIQPLIEQYLATLPSLNRKEKGDEKQITPFQKGKQICHFTREMETPKTSIGLVYSGIIPYNLKQLIISQVFDLALNQNLTDLVRLQESATYGVHAPVSLHDFPEGRATIQVYFDTDPEKLDRILNLVKSEIEKIAKEGLQQKYLDVSISNILRSRAESKQENEYWLDVIATYYYRNFDTDTDYEKILKTVTPADVQAFAKALLKQGNLIEVVMSPAKP